MKRILYILILISNSLFAQLFTEPSNLVGFDVDLLLPDTIRIAQGNSIQLYNDNVAYVNYRKHGRVTFDWVAEIGTETDTSLNIKATTLGNYNITLAVYNSRNVLVSYVSSVVKVQPKVAIGSKGLMTIGNSLTALGWQYCKHIIDDSLNITLTSIGVFGSEPNKHVGISGSRWPTTTFPFCYGGVIDFPQFIADSSLATPDIIRFDLGINDSYFLVDPNTTLATASKVIDSALSQTTAKIIIALPTTTANTWFGWMTNYKNILNYENYILNLREYNRLIYNKYNNGAYSDRVYVAYDTFCINRNNSYPKVNGRHSNALHPLQIGYEQFINGTLNTINHIYQ